MCRTYDESTYVEHTLNLLGFGLLETLYMPCHAVTDGAAALSRREQWRVRLPRRFPWRVKLATPLAVAQQNLG